MPRHRTFALVLAVLPITIAAPARAALSFFNELGGNPLGSQSEWTNYIRLDDLDGDGDLDVIVPNCGGFFSNPQPQAFRVYLNDGKAAFKEDESGIGGPFSAPIRVVDLGDIDGDGDLDLFAPSAGGLADRLYVNGGKGQFADEAAARIGSSSHSGAVRFGDVDGDGDLDLFVAGGYAVSEPLPMHLYLNDGAGKFSEVKSGLPPSAPGDIDDIDLFDADRDFDLDLLVNSHAGKPRLWLNDGKGGFSDASGQISGTFNAFKYGPTACDVDGDGDLDLWFDNAGPGYTEELLINDGKGHFADETAARVTGNPGADDNGVVCADVDLDGDFDAIVVSLGDQERVLLNDGSGNFQNVGGFSAANDSTLWLDAGDLDGDGRLDAVTGQGESGNLRDRVYLGVNDNPVDKRAPVIVASEKLASVPAGMALPLRFAVFDRISVDAGPRVKASLRVTPNGGAPVIVPARFGGGDLFRGVVPAQPDGTSFTVEACATDMQGNSGCGPKASYVAAMGGAGGGGGAGGAGPSTTNATVASEAATSVDTGATAGAGGSAPGGPASKAGCSCEAGGTSANPGWLALLALGVLRRRGFVRASPTPPSPASGGG